MVALAALDTSPRFGCVCPDISCAGLQISTPVRAMGIESVRAGTGRGRGATPDAAVLVKMSAHECR